MRVRITIFPKGTYKEQFVVDSIFGTKGLQSKCSKFCTRPPIDPKFCPVNHVSIPIIPVIFRNRFMGPPLTLMCVFLLQCDYSHQGDYSCHENTVFQNIGEVISQATSVPFCQSFRGGLVLMIGSHSINFISPLIFSSKLPPAEFP